MKKISSIIIALIGIILIISGGVILFKTNNNKKTVQKEEETSYFGSKATNEEKDYYKEVTTALEKKSSLYQVYYIHPKENSDATLPLEMVEEIVDESKKNNLINFLSQITAKEKLFSGVGWEPDVEVIKIKADSDKDYISIYPCADTFCVLIYGDNKVDGFFFDEKQDVYDLVKSDNPN